MHIGIFPAKEEYAKAHFERVNKKLSRLPLADIDAQYRADTKQYYTFDLLTPQQYRGWIADLKKGLMHDLLTGKVRVRT